MTENKDKNRDQQHEVDELRHELQTAHVTKPSNVSKAKYNRWLVADDNQKVGTHSRHELAAFANERQSVKEHFQQVMQQRTSEAKEQREAASERVRQHRLRMQERGERTREEADDQIETVRQQRLAFKQHAVHNAKVYGKELRERVLEEKEAQHEARRNVAIDHKAEALDRAQRFAAESRRQLEEKRRRVQQIRQETHPSVAQHSKDQFYQRRKHVAEDVRQSVQIWREEQEYQHSEHAARAAANHAAAVETQQNVVDGMAILKDIRKDDATSIRSNLESMRLHREHMKLSVEAAKRDVHDETFINKYVPPQQAELVETSDIDRISNQHREDLLLRGPARETGKPNWITFFGNTDHSGFFKGWFE